MPSRPSIRPSRSTGLPLASSATTPPSSAASRGGGALPWSQSSTALAFSACTRRRITPRPAARSNASTRPSSSSSPKQSPAESLTHLQLQLDAFRTIYNQQRPHRALDGRTPLQAFHARLKASPLMGQPQVDYRFRRDRLDADGRVTLRYLSRLRHFHVSYKHRGQPVMLLVAGAHVRVIAEDGQLLRELTLDPSRDYQRSSAPTLVRHQVRQRSASTET